MGAYFFCKSAYIILLSNTFHIKKMINRLQLAINHDGIPLHRYIATRKKNLDQYIITQTESN